MACDDDTPPTNPRRSVQLLSLVDFKEAAQRVIDAVARGRVESGYEELDWPVWPEED